MKRKTIIWIVLAIALVALAAYYRYVPGRTPPGQPALASLDPVTFEQQFRAASSQTRLLVMLSPT